jgi:hypothetical protein
VNDDIRKSVSIFYERAVFSRPEESPFGNHISINPIFVNGVGIGKISTVGVYGQSPSCDTFDMAFKASCLVDARTYEEGTAIF